MANRNANGEGGIYWRESRKRWEARATVGFSVDGRPIRLTGTGRTRKAAAEALASNREKRRRTESARLADIDLPAAPTVTAYLNHWIADVLPTADIATSTADHYASITRTHIIPAVGSIKLADLAPAHVRRMLRKMDDAGLSPNTRRLARAVLRRALKTAVSDGLIDRNAAADTDGVKLGKRNGRSLTPEQARQLLTATRGTEFAALISILLLVGLRKGEALALAWDDIDLDATMPTLTVRRSLKADAKGKLYADEPKTSGSWRTVHLPAPLVDTLRRHRVEQAERRLAFGAGWGGDQWADLDLVLTTMIGTPYSPSRVTKAVKQVTADAVGTPFSPHELRHSAASLMLAANVPLKTVSEVLGHASIRLTADVYGHLMPQARDDAASMMTALLG